MASFCRQCSLALFGEDFGDLKGRTSKKDWAEGKAVLVLCEGCGAIQVDPDGNCVSADCLERHGKPPKFDFSGYASPTRYAVLDPKRIRNER